MENLTIEEWLEKSPVLKELSNKVLFVSDEVANVYLEDEKISIGNKDISITLLTKLLTDDNYFSYVSKLFNKEIEYFSVNRIYKGDVLSCCQLNKLEIISGINLLIEYGKLEGIEIFNEKAIKRYNELTNMMSFDGFLKKISGKSYQIQIEGKDYLIPTKEIIDFMNLSEEDFDKFCDNEIKEINGIQKEIFCYAVNRFFISSGVFTDYIVPDNIEKRYNEIRNQEKIDFEAVNKINAIDDDNLDKVKINEDLKNYILDGMPIDAEQIEKAIYIYIKLCKTLTYDDEFFAVRQQGDVARKHEDINNVYNINLTNNKVVCYEFNIIYGKLLEEIGIKFETKTNGLMDGFGGGHASLKFRSGKFLISADSVTSILHGDIAKAKTNQPLVGLKCINKNERTKFEFYDLITKMYTLIVEQETNSKNVQVEREETFEEILQQYNQTITEYPMIDLNEKLDILINKVNSLNMVGIDSLSYVLHLRKILFSLEERKDNIIVSIVGNSEVVDKEKQAMASAIFTINNEHVLLQGQDNIYYLYNPNGNLLPTSREEIQERFDNGTFIYIDSRDPKIPGIIEGGIKK